MGVLVDVALAHVGGAVGPGAAGTDPEAGRRPPRRRPLTEAGGQGRRPARQAAPRPRPQPTKADAAAAKKADAAQAKAGEDDPEGVTPPPDTKKVEPPESFLDPRAKEALANTFPQVGTRTNAQVISQVKAMARGESQPDPGHDPELRGRDDV